MTFKTFDEDCIAAHIIKQKVKLDKPSYIGFLVLELSKLHIYSFIMIKFKYGIQN